MLMENYLIIIYMILIGAIIGGITNSIAIRMLFRPYKTLFIGKWRIPFTPGLIPKRRDELAEQIGIIVVEHLLTPESIKKKYTNEIFQKEIIEFTKKEMDKWLTSEKSIEEILSSIGLKNVKTRIESELDCLIEKKYEDIMISYRDKPINTIMSQELILKIDDNIPLLGNYIIKKGYDYFSSVEGNLRIERMVDDFIKERSGKLGGMLQMFLGNVSLADKIQPELIKFIQSPGTEEIVTTLIMKEWEKIQHWHASKIEEYFGKGDILDNIKIYAQKIFSIDNVLQTPIQKLSSSYKDQILNDGVPLFINMIVDFAIKRIDLIVEKLRISEIVQEQIKSFSLERLEEIVLSITKKELKMITYLGALLGGIIGFFQGLIATFF